MIWHVLQKVFKCYFVPLPRLSYIYGPIYFKQELFFCRTLNGCFFVLMKLNTGKMYSKMKSLFRTRSNISDGAFIHSILCIWQGSEYTTGNTSFGIIKVNKSRYEQCEVTPHFSTRQNLLKKYWKKINIDTINWEKLFARFADHKLGNILWLLNFNFFCSLYLKCSDC